MGAAYPDAGVTLGFVVSLVGFVGIVFGVVAGLLVARAGYRKVLIWALWVGAAASAAEAFLPSLPLMLGLRVLEGMSHLAIVVAAPTLIAQLSASRHLGFTLTLWSSFFGVAFTILVVLGLPLVDLAGVPALFAAHAVWMVVCAVVLAMRLPVSATPSRLQPRLQLRQILQDHAEIYRSPFIAAPAAGWLFYTLCYLSTLTVIPPFLDPSQRATILGSMPLVSIVVSLTLGVWVMRWLAAVHVVMLGFGLSMAGYLWLWGVPGGAAAALFLAGALGLIQGASFAAVPQLNLSVQARAKANGAMAQMGNIGNTLGTPVFLLVIGFAGYAGMIVLALVLFALGLLVHLWMADRRGDRQP